MARQGRYAERDASRRSTAGWVALLLSAQTGSAVTPAQLLGEEATDVQDRTIDAERSARKLLKRMSKAGIPTGRAKKAQIPVNTGVKRGKGDKR